ncbi:hypothetical protein PF008_g6240 [Phytophthora fragariae]|uniref:Uncharacterized protein n=1 Tax=Phytophthora fragariae TaxID=53985 RepID=A0A6G0S7N1_9STRA|nr:hypothetical protein PF008_g6240 [Phytophthora fragariae]
MTCATCATLMDLAHADWSKTDRRLTNRAAEPSLWLPFKGPLSQANTNKMCKTAFRTV